MLTGLLSGFGVLGATREDFYAAIVRNEGLFPGSSSYRNNNPGNLRAYDSSQPVDSRGFRIFNTLAEGQEALRRQIDLNISRGLTLQEFFTGKPGVYAGYDHTDPAYASKVAGWIGVGLNQPLQETIDGYWGEPTTDTAGVTRPFVPYGPPLPPDYGTPPIVDPNRNITVPFDLIVDTSQPLTQPTTEEGGISPVLLLALGAAAVFIIAS